MVGIFSGTQDILQDEEGMEKDDDDSDDSDKDSEGLKN